VSGVVTRNRESGMLFFYIINQINLVPDADWSIQRYSHAKLHNTAAVM